MHTKLVRLLTSSLHATPIINCCRGSKDFIEKLRAKSKACTSKWDGKYSEGAFLFTLLNTPLKNNLLCQLKGQTNSKWFFQANVSSKKKSEQIRLYYCDTSGRLVFVRFLEEIDDSKKTFRN